MISKSQTWINPSRFLHCPSSLGKGTKTTRDRICLDAYWKKYGSIRIYSSSSFSSYSPLLVFWGLGWKERVQDKRSLTLPPGVATEQSLGFECFSNDNVWALDPHTFSSHIPPQSAWLGGSQVTAALPYLVETETHPVSPLVALSTPENGIQLYAVSAIKGGGTIKKRLCSPPNLKGASWRQNERNKQHMPEGFREEQKC